MEIQHELAELSRTAGPQVFDEAEPFRAAVDDFLSSDSITTGELNLLVDAVRLRGFARLAEMLDRGAEPAAALDAAAEQLSRDRGTTEVAGAGWALAVLGFAVGRVGEDQVRARRTLMTAGPGSVPAPAAAPAEVTLPRQPPPPPQPLPQPPPASQARAAATVPPPPRVLPPPLLPTPAPPRRRTGLVVGLVALVVLVLAAGGAGVAVLLHALGSDDDPTTARSGPGTSTPTFPTDDVAGGTDGSSASGGDEGDPLGIGYPLHDLACGSGYIVVLTSSEGPTPAATAGDALDRFPRAEGRAYLQPEQSCSNLSHLTNKVNLSVVPYLGPFPDAVQACEARMASTDTTTYVIGVDEGETAATYCACSYDAADLPPLNGVDDADPVGNDRFWTLELQYMLWEAGYNPDKLVPGRFGERTVAFVRALQSDDGLTTTGALDPATWSALQDRVCP